MKIKALDALGSEYGWSKKEILEETYFDEYVDLCIEIAERRRHNYLLYIAIISNPHVKDPQRLIHLLSKNLFASIDTAYLEEQFDQKGFERLKLAMAGNPRIKIK